MKMKTTYKNIGIGIIALLLMGGVYMYISGMLTGSQSAEDIGGVVNLSPEDLPQNVGDTVQKDGYTITKELVPADEQGTSGGVADLSKFVTPEYQRIPKKPANMSAEAYAQIVEKMNMISVDITKQIADNKKNNAQNLYTDGWLDIALYRNMLGDTAGAREIWLYLTKVSPGLVQPYGNLANQYMVAQNFPEAEKWYKLAIEKMPQALQYYQDLADVYRAQKRTAEAIALLKAGIAADTKSWSLQVALASLYAAEGDTKNARAQYDAALVRAKAAGSTAAVEAITSEKAELR